jgi:hypothetical protein
MIMINMIMIMIIIFINMIIFIIFIIMALNNFLDNFNGYMYFSTNYIIFHLDMIMILINCFNYY